MSRATEHGHGVPGIFFKYGSFLQPFERSACALTGKADLEPMSLQIRERTTTLIQFLVRLAGIVGGVVVCSGWVSPFACRLSSSQLMSRVSQAYRVGSAAVDQVQARAGKDDDMGKSYSSLPANGNVRRRFYNGI